jgi:HemY protein
LKRFQPLLRLKPEHRESKLVLAELNIAAEDFPAARKALGDLISEDPDSRALTIMAAVERGEGSSDTVVKGWLARALNAPRGPQWVCTNCHNIHSDWAPVCENCQAFDTLSWQVPPAGAVDSATGVQMLPLIVGALEEATAPEQPEAVEAAEPAQDDPTPDVAEVSEAEIIPMPTDHVIDDPDTPRQAANDGSK